MRDIGIVICNYNKEDYIVNCIRSVIKSSVNNFDIYVVDNASTDNSVIRIREEFGNTINLIQNKDNLGGSGGFNTGLREALKYNYKYIMLLDNDIVLDQFAVEELYKFMEGHEEVGMAGSKVYFMDYPDRIWGYGGNISFEKYVQVDNYKNCTDGDNIPEILYCDYVAACSLMVKAEAVKKVGIMPEENFIYWDDMEWGYRFNQAGYKVAVYGKSKIWHKVGGRNSGDTFINYYMWRNRIRFFLRILSKERKKNFAESILSDMFRLIYSCNLKGETNIVKSVMYAFDDAIHGIAGKASKYKILKRNSECDRLTQAIGNSKTVLISFNGNFEGLGNIIRKIEKISGLDNISISIERCNELLGEITVQFQKCKVIAEYEPEKYDYHMKMCDHIFDIGDSIDEDNYVDSWCNIINGKKEGAYCSNFENSKTIFVLCMKELLINA